jgi:hypothetical protein
MDIVPYIIRSFPGYPARPGLLRQERRLIAMVQRGSTKSADEIVMRHVGFVMYLLREIVYPSVLWRLGDDILADAMLMHYGKVKTYNLRYRDRRRRRKPVRFVSYIWKRVDGFIMMPSIGNTATLRWRTWTLGRWVHPR